MNWLTWALLSATFAGLTAVLAKAGVRDVNSDLAMAVRTTVIVALAWLWAAVQLGERLAEQIRELSGTAWLFLVLSALATGASWVCYFRALQAGDVSRVAPIDKLSVVVAMVLAFVLLRETVTWQHCLGGVLIAVGAVVLAIEF
jgi:transporter family protein